MSQSLTFNTYLNKFVVVGLSSKPDSTGNLVYGIYFSYSNDLVHWSRRKLAKRAELPWSYQCGDQNPIAHPSLLDPASPSRSFETTGKTGYLYYTRRNYSSCRLTLDRDLIRLPIEFQK
jgi:hypothetical protein